MKNERIKVIMKLKQNPRSIINPSKYGRLYSYEVESCDNMQIISHV